MTGLRPKRSTRVPAGMVRKRPARLTSPSPSPICFGRQPDRVFGDQGYDGEEAAGAGEEGGKADEADRQERRAGR